VAIPDGTIQPTRPVGLMTSLMVSANMLYVLTSPLPQRG
jgi:hypothetical protein